ncbi:hypothetical protein KY290_001168 [Solanum tuberosum]|uniref:DUF4283 domain-containing protein n=1 Tax=Solanum tuberosum TaxID=4113 RepID=A0ABQ7WLG2_SOLTU|nr:hypothetical protein KY290_001168 [Solanum tuberosum]
MSNLVDHPYIKYNFPATFTLNIFFVTTLITEPGTSYLSSFPDILPSRTMENSFKDKLMANEYIFDMDMGERSNINEPSTSELPIENPADQSLTNKVKTITLSPKDNERLWAPWKHSLIIKIIGKCIAHQYLRQKIQALWQLPENPPLIDLGSDYFIVKLSKEETSTYVLQNGPWFINGYFLSTKIWEPNFNPAKAKQIFTTIWVRLPQLPTEFYDGILLRRIGNSIGKLLKIDACTSSTLHGRYARLCVQIPMEEPVTISIQIGNHKQDIVYEGEGFLCKNCGRLGHTIQICPHRAFLQQDKKSLKDYLTEDSSPTKNLQTNGKGTSIEQQGTQQPSDQWHTEDDIGMVNVKPRNSVDSPATPAIQTRQTTLSLSTENNPTKEKYLANTISHVAMQNTEENLPNISSTTNTLALANTLASISSITTQQSSSELNHSTLSNNPTHYKENVQSNYSGAPKSPPPSDPTLIKDHQSKDEQPQLTIRSPTSSPISSNICYSTNAPSTPTPIMGGNSAAGTCNTFLHEYQWCGNHDTTSKSKLSCPDCHRGDETCNGTLCESNVGNQHNGPSLTSSDPFFLQHHARPLELASASKPLSEHVQHSAVTILHSFGCVEPKPSHLPVATTTSSIGKPHLEPKPHPYGNSLVLYFKSNRGKRDRTGERLIHKNIKLRRSALMIFPEEEDKKYILNCPLALKKCSFDLRPPLNTTLAKYAVVMTPTMFPSQLPTLENQESQTPPSNMSLMNQPTSFVIWITTGTNNNNFRRTFRELIRNHSLCMVALLETKVENNSDLKNDFGFDDYYEVSAQGRSGGSSCFGFPAW